MKRTLLLWRYALWQWWEHVHLWPRQADQISLRRLKRIARRNGGRNVTNILLFVSAQKGIHEWSITAEGPSFGFGPVQEQFQEMWAAQIRREQEPIRPYEGPAPGHKLTPKQLARIEKWWYKSEEQRRAGNEAGRRKERAVLEQITSDFKRFWPYMQARLWLMSSRRLADKIRFREDSRGQDRTFDLRISGRPYDISVVFLPGRIDLRLSEGQNHDNSATSP